MGKYQEAINFYTEGIKLTKTDQHVLFSNRSAAYAANGDYQQAIEDAQQCIDINPSWSKVSFSFLFLIRKRDISVLEKHF